MNSGNAGCDTLRQIYYHETSGSVDDLVLELDQNHKRSQWKLARIIVTYPGKDGLVRKARIKTQDGEYDRPIHKLCLPATKEELNAEFS